MEVSQEARATVSDGNLPAQGTLDVDRLAQHARLLGRKEERSRILKLFHDEAGSPLLLAIFEAQLVKEDLESRDLKEAEHGPRPKPPLGFARHGYGPTRQWPKSRPCPNLATQRPFRSPRSFAVLQVSEQKKMRLLRSNDTPKVRQHPVNGCCASFGRHANIASG
jgi:hypothetical protein